MRTTDYGTPEWKTRHANELCRSRGVQRCVFDFIVHNMSERAAFAALQAMPVLQTHFLRPPDA